MQKLVGQSDWASTDDDTIDTVSSPPINASHDRITAHLTGIWLVSLVTTSAWHPKSSPHHTKDRPLPLPASTVSVPLRHAHHSSKRRITTKNEGTNRTAKQVEAIIPLNTATPMDLRALAPAPVASTNGSTPRMKANDVIRIGRNRVRAASTAASRSGLPSCKCCSRATSTIRIAFFADSARSKTSPIWVYRLSATPRLLSARTGPTRESGTASSTENGRNQLSYCPARTRYINSIAIAKTQ